MSKLGLVEYWERQDELKIGMGEWRAKVYESVQKREEEEWRRRMEGKSKLMTYRKFKKVLEREVYCRKVRRDRGG